MGVEGAFFRVLAVGAVGLALSVGIERFLVPRPFLIRPKEAWGAHVALWCAVYTPLVLLMDRPWCALAATSAMLVTLVLVSNAKYKSLREPFLFHDYDYFLDAIRYPRLFLPFLGLKSFCLAAVFFILALLGFLYEQPPARFTPYDQLGGELALLTAAAKAAMADGTLPEAELPAFIVEIPADVKNGDIASNIAMAGARTWRKAPKMIADALIAHLPALDGGVFAKVEVAGPGFINLFLAPSFWAGVVLGACSNKEYGRTDHGKGAKYNVEFVSANPTGPMHMGNARGGALGDCLAAVLDWSGYDVTREFYINDAGNQIQKFGKSLAVRYLQKYCGEEAYPLPAECYQGGDIKVLAGEFAELNGDKYVASCKGMDEETLFESEAFAALKDALVAYALPKNIAALKRDLGKYRIDYDVWFHESTLHESGAVLAVVDKLLELGACYKAEDGAIMYRSAQYAAKYGTVNKKKTDDGTEEEAKDEVLVRANGIPTYFAADIAYHYNKLATRGFAKAIDVWGADHHGHVARMKGAMDAIGLHGEDLDVVLMQMVNLMRDGQPVRMSKRTGNAITLTDLLEEVPIDSARFLFNMHDAGSGIDFDLDQAVKTDNDNPVYYVQYAHARICSILKKMESEGVAFAGAENIDATLLTEPSEMDLIRMLAAFPQEIVMAAEKYDPSRINRFVIDLASAFHRFYGSCRIQGADPAVQQARLALCIGVKNVIFNVLTMFKINVPEKM